MQNGGIFRAIVAIIAAMALILAVISLADSQVDYQTMSVSGYLFTVEDGEGNVRFSVSDAGAVDGIQALDADGAVTLNSTLDVDGNVSSGTGAFTITDSLNVTGAVDFDSTFNADGAAAFNSTVDIDGNISSGTGAVTVTDQFLVDGAADAVQLTVQGYTTQTSSLAVFEQSDGTDLVTISGAGVLDVNGHEVTLDADADTSVTADTDDQIDFEIAGQDVISFTQQSSHFLMDVYLRYPTLKKTASYSVLRSDSGALILNMGASAEITLTLPSATEGLGYCFYVADAYTVTIDPASGDQVHHLTNSAGDRLQNTGTAGDSVCLTSVDGTYWVPTQEVGTWSDAD